MNPAKKALNRVPRGLLKIMAVLGAALALFSLFRGIFLWRYEDHFALYSAGDLFGAFVTGLRFDAASACLLSLPFFLTVLLPEKILPLRLARWLSRLALLPIPASVFLLIIDLHYYGESGRRLSYEVFSLSGDVRAVVGMIVHYTFSLAVFLGLCIAMVYLLDRGVRRIGQSQAASPHWTTKIVSVFF